jgi:hypothetical protein
MMKKKRANSMALALAPVARRLAHKGPCLQRAMQIIENQLD